MLAYGQKDGRWGNMGIGLPMRKFGCFVTCLAMIKGITPDNVLNMLMSNNCFNDNGELIDERAAGVLGFPKYTKYQASDVDLSTVYPFTPPVIAETHDNAPLGYPQHFFVLLSDGTIIDPLDGQSKANPYKIVSYRVFA